MENESIRLSVVIPVFRSAEILPQLQRRLTHVLDDMDKRWEVVLVDDGSSDGTWTRMLELRRQDFRYKLIQLIRNHGQQQALICGLQHASGERIITMDDDLQNPPEEIPRLLAKLDEGFDIAIGKISQHKKHSLFRNLGSRFIQQLTERILRKPSHITLSSFRALSGSAAAAISAYRGAHPYFPALMLNSVAQDRIANVEVKHDERAHGRSTYTLRKLVKLASYLLINHSTLPLRFVTLWGLLLSIGALAYAAYVLFSAIFNDSSAAGWPSLAIMVSFFSGNILMALGIIGEYVGRMLEEQSRANQFFIARKEF
ncbi:MAG TPA: glycosyltransferase family 2 protein [Gammaproteobacteria bacterium]